MLRYSDSILRSVLCDSIYQFHFANPVLRYPVALPSFSLSSVTGSSSCTLILIPLNQAIADRSIPKKFQIAGVPESRMEIGGDRYPRFQIVQGRFVLPRQVCEISVAREVIAR